MIRILSVALLLTALLSAEIVDFSDVRHDYLPSESGKVEKTDGVLHMDTSEKILSFTSGHRALIHIRYEQIREVVYEQGNDHLLTIYFRPGGARDASRFRLRGPNRTEILRRLNTQMPESVTRTGF